jgi:hypothetical protein
LSPDRSNDYFVSTRSEGRPPVWTWEIQRRSRPLGVRLYGGGFKSEFAAKLAGEKALSELRAGLAQQRADPVASPGAAVEDEDTPSCPRCSGPMKLVRTIPRFGSQPELCVFRCTLCNHVETREQRGPGGAGAP